MTKDISVMPIFYDYVLGSTYPIIILPGGRNSGKSWFMEQLAVINTNNKEDYTFMVVEDVETNIGEGVKDGIEERIEEFGYDSVYTSTKTPPKIQHANGNKVIFKGYHSKKQQKQVKSLNGITAAWYEEGENITKKQFKALRMQLRGGKAEDRQLFITMNPENEEGYINQEFFCKPADEVLEYFDDGRPKVFVRNVEVEIDDELVVLKCLVVCTTHRDNPWLTAEQRADVEELKVSDPDEYAKLAECKFVTPKGRLIKNTNKFSLSKLDLSQAASIKAVVDTATSGADSATLGIYAKYDDEHHYLIDAVKDDDVNTDLVIQKMVRKINMYPVTEVHVEKNHEGMYFKSEIDKGTPSSVFVNDFHSSENKHEKILSRTGQITHHLYFRDDGDEDCEEFEQEVKQYNKDPKKNKNIHDDCIDNNAMYFKHVDGQQSWGW